MAKVKNKLDMTVNWNGPFKREYFLDSLIKEHNWSVGIEVGVRFGRTLFHLLDNNPTLKMYAVDRDISQFYNSTVKEKYNDRLVVFEGNSWEEAANIVDIVDFVFIDAGHGTKSVINDINAYRPLLKTINGLTGHDIDYPSIQQALTNLEIVYDVGPDNVWVAK